MHYSLRWKILVFTIVPPIVLAFATLWLVNRWVTHQANSGLHDSLTRASSVFESLLDAKTQAYLASSRVLGREELARLLTWEGGPTKTWTRESIQELAREFMRSTDADLVQVVDAKNRPIVSVGSVSPIGADERNALVHAALKGKPQTGLLIAKNGQIRVSVTPVIHKQRVVGALMAGTLLGPEIAREVRDLTGIELTFVSGERANASSLGAQSDRAAVIRALKGVIVQGKGNVVNEAAFFMSGRMQPFLMLARPLPDTDAGDRQLVVFQRSLEAQRKFLTSVRTRLSWLGVLTVALATLTGFVVTVRVIRPVQQLVRGAEEMERGNYDHPLDLQERDELGYLAQRFREMRERERDYVSSLQQVARLKTEFISVASHELRTPISIIKGFHDLFTQGSLGPVSEQQKKALDRIGESLVVMSKIAEDATRMAQIDSERLVLELAEVEVPGLIEQAVSGTTAEAPERDLTITLEVPPDLPPARVDAPRLSLAVVHLVRNAIRFTPDGGFVDVVASRELDQLLIEVRDTGVGIPEERLKVLFTRSMMVRDAMHHHSSSRLEFKSAGLGLGLPIARGVVEAHGGTIRAESRLGRGSRFIVRIPFAGPTPQRQAA